MPKAYLTVDDSPSAQTDALADVLSQRKVPALLFCRGDRLEKNPAPVIRAIQKGFVVGNHAWSHTRFSTLTVEQGIAEIEKTEALIEQAYAAAHVRRPGKYFRFPHLDRGCGGWVVDYNAVPEKHRQVLIDLFSGGLNVDMNHPDAVMNEKKRALQSWLRGHGFRAPAFPGITHGWYNDTEVGQAVDAMFTFSTADWMVTPRHAGKWPYKNLSDLKAKIDDDVFLRQDSAHAILAHDQDGLLDTVIPLIDHFLEKGFTFAPV